MATESLDVEQNRPIEFSKEISNLVLSFVKYACFYVGCLDPTVYMTTLRMGESGSENDESEEYVGRGWSRVGILPNLTLYLRAND